MGKVLQHQFGLLPRTSEQLLPLIMLWGKQVEFAIYIDGRELRGKLYVDVDGNVVFRENEYGNSAA